MKLFDSHCHLQMPQFDADRDAVIARMKEKEMGAVIIGTDFETSRAGLALAKQHNFLWASVGLHPTDKEEWSDISTQMEKLAKDPKVVAIGECGLDYARSEKKEGQRERFEQQIALAQKLNKALVVHCRDAHDDCLNILQNVRMTVPVVIHFFTGKGKLAQRYLDLGCYLSFPGPITYTTMYDDSVRLCPLDNMLVETDSPFAAPVPHRGKRNDPAYVEHVAAKVAAIKGMTTEEVYSRTTHTASSVFKLR